MHAWALLPLCLRGAVYFKSTLVLIFHSKYCTTVKKKEVYSKQPYPQMFTARRQIGIVLFLTKEWGETTTTTTPTHMIYVFPMKAQEICIGFVGS